MNDQSVQEQQLPRHQVVENLPVQKLKGVGPAIADKLQKLGITSIRDVLFHLPLRYEDRTRLHAIGSLRPGQSAVIEGVIEHSEVRYSGKKRYRKDSGRSLLCYLSDGTGGIVLRFFHFSAEQQANLKKGVRLRCFGEVRRSGKNLEIAHPEYRRLFDADFSPLEKNLTPVYPKTEGIHQTLMRSLAKQSMDRLDSMQIAELLPSECSVAGYYALHDALLTIHAPEADGSEKLFEQGKHPAQQRLIFEELVSHRLSMMRLRQKIQKYRARPAKYNQDDLNAFINQLGFELTHGQRCVIEEILCDVSESIPMLRLLQGDVGSGKTVVAGCAVLPFVQHHYQSAVMAPTEILANQLYQNFTSWFGSEKCIYLSGKDKGKIRSEKLAVIKNGKALVVIGTHALFQSDVEFNNLSFIIIDEQHRFGVHQRLALQQKGKNQSLVPHQLIMTATPIPRSLAMTAYADLDYSVIKELPKGRKPTKTIVVPESRRQEVIDRVAEACASGEQAYWVCTLVEESEVLQCQAAEATFEQLKLDLAHLQIGLVHGRMQQQQKDEVITRFKKGGIQLLVATTVIEVGVNVPNASLMIIENAERLGLAQLHQLRGRVGRGDKKSSCVLMYRSPLSDNGKERLAILRETNDGFEIAAKDLKLRGPGEVLGTRQTGVVEMRIADVVRDEYLFAEVKAAAQLIQAKYPQNIQPLIDRWMGSAEQFGSV